MSKFARIVAGLVTMVAVLALLIVGTNHHQTQSTKPIRVATSLNFYGEAATQVAGKYGTVTTFIKNAAVDPHDYQPGTLQAQQVARANVIVVNGLGYDTWLTKLANASDKGHQIINVASSIAHKSFGANEHIWYRPQTMPDLTLKLATRFGRLDPAHRQYYMRRAHQYCRKLMAVNRQRVKCRRLVNHSRRLVDVTEPVFDYALASLGYRVNNPHFAKAIEDDNDPSPHDISSMQSDLRHRRIAFLVVNTQETNATIDNMVRLAKQCHIPLLRVTEAKPARKTYVSWMLSQYRELARIQRAEEE